VSIYFGRRLNAAFAVNTAFVFYALWRFVGVSPACGDLAPLARSLRQCWAAVRATWARSVPGLSAA